MYHRYFDLEKEEHHWLAVVGIDPSRSEVGSFESDPPLAGWVAIPTKEWELPTLSVC